MVTPQDVEFYKGNEQYMSKANPTPKDADFYKPKGKSKGGKSSKKYYTPATQEEAPQQKQEQVYQIEVPTAQQDLAQRRTTQQQPQTNKVLQRFNSGVERVPYSTVTPAGGYKEYIQGKNPVTASVSYGVSKGTAYLAKGEEKQGGQNFFGNERVQQVAQVVPYANPITGPALGTAAGIAQFTTKGGRQELKTDFAESFVKGTTTTMLSLTGAGLGPVKSAKQISRGLGLPKYDVKMLSRSVNKDNGIISSEIAAIVNEKTLFGTNKYLTGAKIFTRETKLSDTQSILKSAGVVASAKEVRPVVKLIPNHIELPPAYSKTSFSGVQSFGISTKNKVTLAQEINKYFKAVNTKEVITVPFTSRVTTLGKRFNKESYYAGGGLSYNIGKDVSLVYTKSKPLKESKLFQNLRLGKTGETKTFGYDKLVKELEFDTGFGALKGKKSGNSYVQELEKQLISQSVQNRNTKLFDKVKLTPSQGLIPRYPTIVGGTGLSGTYKNTGQYEKTEEVTAYLPKVTLGAKPKELNFVNLGSIIKSGSKGRSKSGTLQRQISIVEQASPVKNVERILQNQRQRQNYRVSQKQIRQYGTPSLRHTFGYGTSFKVPLPFFKPSKHKVKQPSFDVGFKTYFKKKGKEYYLPGVRSRGEAIKFGEAFTLKNLRATFGIKRTGGIISNVKNSDYSPSALFRAYKIKGGQRIPLMDEFIQKRGKRLSTGLEIAELRSYRRRR